MPPVINVRDVSVALALPASRTQSLKELLVRRPKESPRRHEIQALSNVDLTVGAGEILGVIGRNGAGKTTLLKVIGGILRPTAGRVLVRGRVTPVLGLGIGLHPDLTGRENLMLLGTLLGRTPREMHRRAGAIAEWAGLDEHLDLSLRTYSAGMMARLAMAVMTDEQPDVLLLDEIFAIGDADFQDRSRQRLAALRSGGCTILLVSHDVATVSDWCDHAVWLDGGRVAHFGAAEETVARYAEFVTSSS